MSSAENFTQSAIYYFYSHSTPYLFTILVLNLKKKSLLPIDVSEIAGWVANSVNPDQTPQNVASDLGLRCLLKPVYPNTKVNYAVHFTAVLKSGVSLGKFNRRQIDDIFSYFFF